MRFCLQTKKYLITETLFLIHGMHAYILHTYTVSVGKERCRESPGKKYVTGKPIIILRTTIGLSQSRLKIRFVDFFINAN